MLALPECQCYCG